LLEAIAKKETTKAIGGKRRPAKKAAKKPKSIVVYELLAVNGEAGHDKTLTAAQVRDSRITKFDLENGLHTLTKRSKIKVALDDRSRLLPT